MPEAKNIVTIDVQMTEVINYALQQNRIPITQEVIIHNATASDLYAIELRIWSEPEITASLEQRIELVSAGTDFSLKNIPLTAKAEFLAGLTERITGELHISLEQNGEVLAEVHREIVALAFDEWHGSLFFPELLAAFVTPNHPEVTKLNAKAAELLQKWSGDPSFNAYQTKNPNRVRMQTAAVYGALQSQNIVYSVPPASFEAIGQRVRLCGDVVHQKMGTCLDLTLLYASCLEAIGLHPLLLLQKDHIFLGVWLENMSFSEAVQDDPSLITKRLADGVGEMEVVECTVMTSGKTIGFDEASKLAVQSLNGEDSLEYIIDVSRARLSGIRPLPLRIYQMDSWRIEQEEHSEEQITAPPTALGEKIDVTEGTSVTPEKRKLTQWERKLLDLSLRNTLINMRLSQTVIPILSTSLGDLEDALSNGSEYGIAPRPAEWALKGLEQNRFESVSDLGPFKELIKSEFQNKRLRSIFGDSELTRAIVNLYRSSRVSLEENGANTLYLALGLLCWYETKTSQRARYAPIVLLPVEIIRKSANKGYVIRLRDEDPQMNITLLEMLKQDYGIMVSGLDPLPLDDQGVDMRTVFTVLRRAVMDQPRWDVVESAFLGTFSFSQFVMWNDVRNRAEGLQQNKIVKSLIDGKLAWDATSIELKKRIDGTDTLLPIPADASQLLAICSASKGESFVLHGPPGTGKSQTITALIANALAQGKRVLFVAEKMAALSVVQKRLSAIGIAPFCLELHSNKSKKRDVLDQLRAASEVAKITSPEEYAAKAEQAAQLRLELDAYAHSLHHRRKSGLSLFEMVCGFENSHAEEQRLRFSADFAEQVTPELLTQQQMLTESMIVAGRSVGHPSGHPLCRVKKQDYSQQLRVSLPEQLAAYRTALDRLESAGNMLTEQIDQPAPVSLKDWEKFGAISNELSFWLTIPRTWAKKENFNEAMNEIRAMASHYKSSDELCQTLLSDWSEDFLLQSGEALKTQWDSLSIKWFLPKLLGQSRIVKMLAPYSKTSINKEDLGTVFHMLMEYQKEKAAGDDLFTRYGDDLGELYSQEGTDWEKVTSLTLEAKRSAEALDELTNGHATRRSHASRRELSQTIESMNQSAVAAFSSRDALYASLDIKARTADQTLWLEKERQLLSGLEQHASELREWILWNTVAQEARNCALNPLVDAYESGLEHDQVMVSYQNALYTALINHTIDNDEALGKFSGALFNEKIEQFRRLDCELRDLAQSEIFYRLASRVPNLAKEASQNSEVGILQRAIRSGGRGLSIRRLFEQIPNLLSRLCPCMLMSPISAAQYLDPKHTLFDIVVFDEASQLPTHKAVGALARGENAVIVGDPKQMPPTSFFSGNIIDEDNLESEDLESILDDCLALNLPQTHLLWHYRSRHESLIAFSNSCFYENKLCTFPSVNDRESKVSLVSVKGYFDRGGTRTNRGEAEAIVVELIHRYHEPSSTGQSVGVVTFNISQQNLIDDLLTEACKADPELEAWAYEAEEPLFIKNLENVQGDERDVILFSIGYGPDLQGKVTMNFGPLNREGGWRRLNVAVSRARQEMIVFSTLAPEQIDLSRTSAEGVAALKAFLEYANGCTLANTETTVFKRLEEKGSIADSVCKALSQSGYTSQKMVGTSKYRVDVGVGSPQNPRQYLLGILLDGESYHTAQTTRDREVSQVSVLKGLGWNIYRIWTVDWWENSAREKERLLTYLKELERQPEQAVSIAKNRQVEKPAPEAVPFSSEKLAKGFSTLSESPTAVTVVYQAAFLPNQTLTPEEFLLPQHTRQIQSLILRILDAEAPITEALLTRRLMQSFGISRAGSRLQARTFELLSIMGIFYTIQNKQKVYWKEGQTPDSYLRFRSTGIEENKRDAKDIPFHETANAACTVLEEQIGLPREDLIRETAKLLGYVRMGNFVVAAMSDGINYAMTQNRICADQYGYLKLPR